MLAVTCSWPGSTQWNITLVFDGRLSLNEELTVIFPDHFITLNAFVRFVMSAAQYTDLKKWDFLLFLGDLDWAMPPLFYSARLIFISTGFSLKKPTPNWHLFSHSGVNLIYLNNLIYYQHIICKCVFRISFPIIMKEATLYTVHTVNSSELTKCNLW